MSPNLVYAASASVPWRASHRASIVSRKPDVSAHASSRSSSSSRCCCRVVAWLNWVSRSFRATDWLAAGSTTGHLAIGYFGASTGAGAALVAAAQRPDIVRAIVSRGGRPDLAGDALARVTAPTLLIVGGRDRPVIGMNRDAMAQMRGEVKLEIVPGASHLFEEPGTLETVARLARDWFTHHLG